MKRRRLLQAASAAFVLPGIASAQSYPVKPIRSPQLKDIPTMEEIGFKGFDAIQWYGSVGPAGISAAVVQRLNEAQVAVLKLPDLADKLAGEAVEPWPMTPEQFGHYIRSEVDRWTTLAKARGIRLEE